MTDPREIEALCAEAESPLVHRVQHFDALTGSTVDPHCVACGRASGWPCASVRAATALRAFADQPNECCHCGAGARDMLLPPQVYCGVCHERFFASFPPEITWLAVAGVGWTKVRDEWYSDVHGLVASKEGTPRQLDDALNECAALLAQCAALRADVKALAAQLAAAQTENTRLRAALAQSKDPCVYCQLPAEKMARCRSGFPGCARADDMAGCPEFGASMEVHSLREQLAAARADTERLDWLERRVRTVYDVSVIRCPDRETEPDDTLAGFGLSTSPKCIFQGTGDTLREAIDAAKGGA